MIEGMKYIGPVAVTSDEIKKLHDYCREQEVMFYFWGLPGEQYFAVSGSKLAALDPRKLPAAFAGQEWNESPYRFLQDVIEALPPEEQEAIAERAAELIAEEAEAVEPEQFIENMTEEVVEEPADDT